MKHSERAIERARTCAACNHLERRREAGDAISGACTACRSRCRVLRSEPGGPVTITVRGEAVECIPYGQLVHGGECPRGKWADA